MSVKKYENECERAILKTLAYRSVFKYPLSFYQLSNFLICNKKFSAQEIKESVNKLIANNIVKKKYKRYVIKNKRYHDWKLKLAQSKDVLNQNRKYIDLLAKIPWVKMICITGSVAAYNAEADSDIDLLIVTSKKRLWLTRGFTAVILAILNKQPFGGEEVPGSICTNIFMEEAHLEWSKEKQNIYTATDILLMQPLVNRENSYFKFIKANEWLFEFYKNFEINFSESFDKSTHHTSKLITNLEDAARNMQLVYMQKKKTSEVTTKYLIHFNKHDSTAPVLSAYKHALKVLKV